MARFGIGEPDWEGSDAKGQDSSTAPGQLWGYVSHRHERRADGRIRFGGCSGIGDYFRPVDHRACLAWGIALLVCFTYLVARNRGASVTSELIKHIALAAVVIVASG